MKIIVCILIALFTMSCDIGGGPDDLKNNCKVNKNGIAYELFYIEGMPCMRVGRSMGDGIWEYDGVTCDWYKWETTERR